MPNAISRNYMRIGTSTLQADLITERIDNTTLHSTPTLPTPPHTITCNDFSISPDTPHVSGYQSSASDFSHTACEHNVCGTRGMAGSHHHTCPCYDDNYCPQFVSYTEATELQKIRLPTEALYSGSAPLTPIDPAIFEWYTPLTVEQIRVEAYKEDIASIYEHYK